MYYYTGSPDWVFQVFSFAGFLLCMLPLPAHLEAWNVGTCLYMLWTGLACLILFINSVVWQGNMLDWSPTWCDISTHALVGFNLAVPATSLCINRRLYQIASVKSVTKSKAEQRREILADLLIGLGLPLLQIPLQYVVQGHRYNIFEDIGCLGETFETPVSVVLWHLPPILVGCVSAVYCILSIRGFYASRKQFKELLASGNNNNLNLNRYLRLMALASIDLIFNIPLGVWVLYTNIAVVGLSPWKSWADTHSNFSKVYQIAGFIWRSDPATVASLETFRWATVFCAFIFAMFFTWAEESRKNYKRAYYAVASKLGLSTSKDSTAGVSSNRWSANGMAFKGDGLPSFVRQPSIRKRDSLDSLSSAELGSLSYSGKEKSSTMPPSPSSYAGGHSFGGLTLQDVGGLLPPPDYASEIGLSPVESSSSGSFYRSEADAESIQSVALPAPPAPAHVV